VTASFGVAQADVGDGTNGLEQLLRRADQALYAAKKGGRNRVVASYPQRASA
ncbi:MAG: Diguanylate cyclase, domain, partial [Proteobacteria bacterium]|nr:Diguanylate cyclase, domain [Pseudomonadota bacterium]